MLLCQIVIATSLEPVVTLVIVIVLAASVNVCPMFSVSNVTNVNVTTGNLRVDLAVKLVIVIQPVHWRLSAMK